MATPSSKRLIPEGKGKNPMAPLQPVLTVPGPVPKALSFAHPAILSGLFISQFTSLVEDPVSTLKFSLAILVPVQIVYAALCLPPAGSRPAKAPRKPRSGEKKKPEEAGPNLAVAATLSLALTTLVTPLIHIAFVLFGAPFLTHIPHTFLLAAHFTILVLFPLFYVHGVDSAAWIEIGSLYAPIDETSGGLWGALFGAWLGAVPIPLDWDREWQKWPVTVLYGLYAGCVLGKLLGGQVLLGKRFRQIEEADKLE